MSNAANGYEATGGVDEDIYAFPSGVPRDGDTWASDMGMTLRDYFAAKAMNRMIARAEMHFDDHKKNNALFDQEEWEYFHEYIAEQSYLIANAMMKARNITSSTSNEN